MLPSREDLPILFKELMIRLITLDYHVLKKIIHKELQIKNGAKILDIGCGTGILAPLFSNTNYIGIDIDEKLIDFANKRYPNKFKLMNGDKINFPNSLFDVILIIGVIHHLDNKTSIKVFSQMKKVLKKYGMILIIEAIPPIDSYNYFGHFLRALDKGHNIRYLEEYEYMFRKYFKVNKAYKKRGGLVDYGVFVLTR